MSIEQDIGRFKIQLLRKMPFYGDIVMHLSFIEDKRIPTAATNGKFIWYNPKFLAELSEGQRNFVLMHEVFHVLLRHGIRNAGAKRDQDIWNIACDILVNNMLMELRYDMLRAKIPFELPSVGVFSRVDRNETAENLYAKIYEDNKHKSKNTKKLKIRVRYAGNSSSDIDIKEVDIPSDIRVFELTSDQLDVNDEILKELIRRASSDNRGTMKSHFVPTEVYALTQSKKLNWKKLLRDFLTQEIGDDTSYTTPERKYLHMDLILPGHSMTEETLEEIWAFVDSSGSVGKNDMEQFLTQIYRISKEFKCVFNICYWDTSVTDVYKKVLSEKEVMKCIPHHSGGTDINCVYEWIHENKVKPDIIIILTDGYFGRLRTPTFSSKLGKKTILVLSSDIVVNDDMKRIGKIARL